MKYNKIYLDAEFKRIWRKLENGDNITLMRYGDGERAIMTGRSLVAQEGWSSPNTIGKLGNDLLKTLEINHEQVFHAISCPCCDQSSYYWYSTRIVNTNKTFANLWVNANYPSFIKHFTELNREAVVVANYRAIGKQIGKLKILKHYSISDDCFDFWENYGEELLANIKKDFGNRKNLLYVISAGPMAEPIIGELFKENPDNCYIDFGSSIDRFYRQTQTRPYEDKKSVYAKRNCWMYDPQKMNFDVSAVLTMYKRPENLVEQLDVLERQTLKPREILLFHDAANPPIEFDESLRSRLTNYIKVDNNVGVWGRFAAGLLATSKYVCFFDDDTIPGSRWLENCHTQMLKRKGLYGAIGIDAWDLENYPYKGYQRWGWAAPADDAKEVDFVGHSWFLEKDWLGVMWINSSEFYAFRYVSEDAFLSFSLKKWLNIKTYVPPHPKNNLDLFGSLPDKALEYGRDLDLAISFNPQQLERMNKALRLLVKQGMRSKRFKLSNILSERYLREKFFPDNSRQRLLAKKFMRMIKEIRGKF